MMLSITYNLTEGFWGILRLNHPRVNHISPQIADQVWKCCKCVYFSKDLGSSRVRCRHPDRIPQLLFSLLPARGGGATKDGLHPKITGTMPLKRTVNMNGKVFLFFQVRVITLLGFLCCQPVPGERAWKYSPRSGGAQHRHNSLLPWQRLVWCSAHTCDFDEVLFLSSVLWFFLTGVGMSGYSTPDNCTSGLSSNRVTGTTAGPGEKNVWEGRTQTMAPPWRSGKFQETKSHNDVMRTPSF